MLTTAYKINLSNSVQSFTVTISSFFTSHSSISSSVALTDSEDQEKRGMQPGGGRLWTPGHLPVQVSLLGYPMSDWTREWFHGGPTPQSVSAAGTNAPYVNRPIM
ncbi:hypothetical protein GOODEAATRI_002820 [Goodea atripinnis]|uniref:Uncharacterized protein n=1 Tax=Goodea atripinnis TaxID=208336 RepID=A0ABV0NHE3_9TELE